MFLLRCVTVAMLFANRGAEPYFREMNAPVRLTYYLDLISSWCFYAEPMYADLKHRYAGRVDFNWRAALIPPEGLPVSRAQEEWFYRRSGTIVRRQKMLNPDWYEQDRREYLAPHLVAEAAREFGIQDDRVRLAITRAALEDGRKVGNLDVALEAGAAAADISPDELRKVAIAPAIEQRVRESTATFYALKVDQRPTFELVSRIGDRAVISGLVVGEPLVATLEAMLDDVAAYESHRVHFGDPPSA